jgi:hypothetical protein
MLIPRAFTDPRVLYLDMDCEPKERTPISRPGLLWVRERPPLPDYFRLKIYLESDYDPYFLNMAKLCTESRRIFLQNYSQLKYRNTHVDLPWNRVRNKWLREEYDGTKARLTPQRRYIDFKRDTLEMNRCFLDAFEKRDGWVDLTKVENFAFCAVDEVPPCPESAHFNSTWWLWDFIKERLPSLKTLTFTLGFVQLQSPGKDKLSLNFVSTDENTLNALRQQSRHSDEHCNLKDRHLDLIESAKQSREKIQRKLERVVSANDSLKSLEFKITLTSTKYRTRHPKSETIWLIPTNPEFYGVCFYAKRPAAIGVSDEQYFHGMKFRAKCNMDGTIVSAVQELEEKNV